MLDVQYRMHPAISRFPSSEFYNFSLHDGTIDAAGNVPARLLPPSSSSLEVNATTGRRPSVVFLDHPGSESMKDSSRVNHSEGSIVCSVVEDLLLQNPASRPQSIIITHGANYRGTLQDLRGSDIGIIAPYVAQIALLSRLLTTCPVHRARFEASLGARRAAQLAHVEVKTVDGFEGREKEVIVFSTVRNNPGGYIGFLADRRRLNVGLTRAKRGLFVVGSMSTLRAGKTSRGPGMEGIGAKGKGGEAWRRYAEFLEREGMVVRLKGARLAGLLYGNGGMPRPHSKVVADPGVVPMQTWSG